MSAMSAGTAWVAVKPDLKGFSRDLGSGLKSAASGLGSFGADMTRKVTLPILAAAGAGATMGIKTAAGLEQSELAFKTFYGSAEAAEAVMKDISDFAAKTPFDLPGLTSASMKLAAVGVEADRLIPIMSGVGDAVSGVGGSAEAIDRVTFAMQQVIGQGRAMTQDINQIANTGIPIWGELAAQMGVSTEEIRDLASEGAITSDILIAAFENPVGPMEKFAGMMDEQSQTLTGLWSTFKDTINMALAESLQAALPEIKDGLASLTEAIGPALQAAGPAFAAIAQAVVPLIGHVADLLTWFAGLSPQMQQWIVYAIAGAAAVGPLASGLGGILRVASGVGGAVKGLATFAKVAAATARVFGVFKVLGGLGGMVLKFGGLVAKALMLVGRAFLMNPIGLLVAAIAGAVFLIVKYWDEIKAAFQVAWEWISGILAGLWETVSGALTAVWDTIKGVFDAVVAVFQGLWDTVKPIWDTFWAIITLPIRIWWTVVSAIFQLLWAGIQFVFQAIVDFVVPIWQSVWDAVSGALSAAWGWLSGVLSAIWEFIKGVFTRIKDTVTGVWDAMWGAVRGAWDAAYGFISGGIAKARDFIVSAFTTVKDKVTAIWDAIKGVVQRAVDAVVGIGSGIWDGLKGIINSGIGFLNAAIRGFNNLIGAVNSVPGVSVPTIPEIPKLAAGGIVNRPTLALVGEAGPEAVIPLSRLRGLDAGHRPSTQVPDVRVFIGDRELTDIVRVEVVEANSASARLLAAGRRP